MWVKALIKAMWGQGKEMGVVMNCNKVYILQERLLATTLQYHRVVF